MLLLGNSHCVVVVLHLQVHVRSRNTYVCHSRDFEHIILMDFIYFVQSLCYIIIYNM